MNTEKISIAIETSCRQGSVALGIGDKLVATSLLGDTGKHAASLLPALDALLKEHNLTPKNIQEIYVSAGPGSFTGLRVGITVARTLGQMLPEANIVAVPTQHAIAENVADQNWKNLGILLAAKNDTVFASLVSRDENNQPVQLEDSQVKPISEILASFPADTIYTGEGLGFTSQDLDSVAKIDQQHWFPKIESVWKIGHKLAKLGKFTDYNNLLPTYSRKPEAVRLWEKRQAQKDTK